MRYFMFIDESGEANVLNPDQRFNVFVLCGILFREDSYDHFNRELKQLKQDIFDDEEIVFHSFEMRKWRGAFGVFKIEEVRNRFYERISKILLECDYKIFSCVVNKEKYKEKYPNRNFAYEDAMTFICERAIMSLGVKNRRDNLLFCLEKRGKRQNSALKKLYTHILKYGTDYVSTDSFKMCHPKLFFRTKYQNINGLQLADLIAYPIAWKALNPNETQPTFEIIKRKFYTSWYGSYRGFGIKMFP